jgi:hypothetical protein
MTQFTYYNFLPSICDYCLDFPKINYINMGITPKHNYKNWNPIDVRKNNIIFVKNDMISHFFENIYPKINNSFFLVNGVGGFDIDKKYEKYLEDDKIIKWYGTNLLFSHEKLFKLPIGFEEPERCVGGSASHNGLHEGGDQNILFKLYRNRTIFDNKINKLFISYMGKTHKSRNEIDNILNYDFMVKGEKMRFEKYLEEINKYKFVLCPRGCGTDTHRFWETLLVGSVPIIENNGLSDLYDKFPCIKVNSFSEITYDLLNSFKIDNLKFQKVDNYLILDNLNNLIIKDIDLNKRGE